MTQEYPWYEIVESDELEQGDFIDNCKVLIPAYIPADLVEEDISTDQDIYQVTGEIAIADVVIVNQSCDLGNGKLDYVLMSPRWSYKDYIQENPEFKKADKLDQIRQGKIYRYFMLNKCDFPELTYETQIVDLGVVFSIPYDVMKQMAKFRGKRLRLCSPYKEKLAQAFGYYYMRIGLPIDIDKVDTKTLAQISANPVQQK